MTDVKTVYKLPFSSASVLWGPCMKEDGAEWIIVYMYAEDDNITRLVTEELIFGGYVPIRMKSFNGPFVDGKWVEEAFDTVVDLGQTEWAQTGRDRFRIPDPDPPYRHLAIYFDEGPSFECLCQTFRVARRFGDETPGPDASAYVLPRIEES